MYTSFHYLHAQINTHTHTHTHTLMHSQPRDPCPSYPVTIYNFTVTERETDRLVTSVPHTGNISLVLDSSKGLVANQVYLLTIEAENRVGSTISEDILLCKWIHTCPYSSFKGPWKLGQVFGGDHVTVVNVNLSVWEEHHSTAASRPGIWFLHVH